MNKYLLITILCALSLVAGCKNDTTNEGLFNETGNTINVNKQRADIYNTNRSPEDFGYVRHKKSPIKGETMNIDYTAVFDREKVADLIGKLETVLPDVDDVSTLVTDEEVLVVYSTDSDNRELVADQVKRTAMSVVPRSYHVYVSDNTNLRKNVESFATMDSGSRNTEFALNKLIKDMKKSPQGKPMGEWQNENGETKDDMDQNM